MKQVLIIIMVFFGSSFSNSLFAQGKTEAKLQRTEVIKDKKDRKSYKKDKPKKSIKQSKRQEIALDRDFDCECDKHPRNHPSHNGKGKKKGHYKCDDDRYDDDDERREKRKRDKDDNDDKPRLPWEKKDTDEHRR